MNAGPYQLPNPFERTLLCAVARFGLRCVERALHVPYLNQTYHAGAAAAGQSRHFTDGALEFLNARLEISDEDLNRIPKNGPLVVVANHPFGGVDGLLLNAILRRVRPDVKLFGSIMLERMEAYRPDFFFVDNFGAADAPARNLSATKSALRWVKSGACLGVFPAGEVSHITWKNREVHDPPWNSAIGRLAQASGAAVVPLYFDGHNSTLFQLAGLVHPRLRTIMLARELKNSSNRTIRVCVGHAISPQRVSQFENAEELISHLRLRTYLLRSRLHRKRSSKVAPKPARVEEPIARPQPSEAIEREIDALPPHHQLGEVQEFSVHYAAAGEIPHVLAEIGRLRELTFRRVGEGTGRATDLDRFDDDYLHMFVWHRQQKQLIGAYRMGLSDQLLERNGIAGLYTSTLFNYRRELLEQIGPAIELGRSFVIPEFQRDYAPLMLLWRGIGRFMAAHPKYKMLFGPVSISNDYQSLTKHLLMKFLATSHASEELRSLVSAKNPPKLGHFRPIETELSTAVVGRVEDVDELVNEIESDRAGMPILLRQYLKLNAKLLAFNIDPDFGEVLDGLMLADLTTVSRAMLVRYMGKEEAGRFLAHWNVQQTDVRGD